MLNLVAVAKEYDLRPILDEITLCIQPGCRYILTAPNGSGKTTLLMIMAGLSKPTRGKVLWNEKPFQKGDRKNLGVVLQQPLLFGDLTGFENLLFYASLYHLRQPKRVAAEWMERVELDSAADMKVKEYSKGMKQRLSLARSLLHSPNVLLLDEPFDGLDGHARSLFQGILSELQGNGSAIFMVTHNEQELAEADFHHTLRFGRLVAV